MKGNPLVVVGLVVFGLLALGLTAFMMLSRGGGGAPSPAPGDTPAETATALVAARTIPPRTTITEDMLEEREVSADEADGAVTNINQVRGRLVTETVQPGQVITTAILSEELGRVIPANFPVPAGLRAVAVYVNADRTVAGLVDVGDRVDVIVTHELTSETLVGAGDLETVAGRTIAQNLEVLAVDRSIRQATPPAAAPGAAAGEEGAAPPPPPPPPPPADGAEQPAVEQANYRVILAAPPEVAERIVAANRNGEINLTIRNPDSNDVTPDTSQALEYPVRLINTVSPEVRAATLQARAANQQRAQERADQLRTERREDRRLAQERADAQRQRREEAALQLRLAEAARVPPMPPAGLPAPSTTTTIVQAPPAPQLPPENDVLVVRGTEKTRVAVPSR